MQMDKIEDNKHIRLSDGREIILQDEDDIFLSFMKHGETQCTVSIPYPDAGYGGGGLLLSPSEQYLAFVYFSGESEEAFTIFRIGQDSLEIEYESEYVYGENGDCYFSEDEKIFMQVLGDGYAGEDEMDAQGNRCYEFGMVNHLKLPEKELTQHMIYVYSEDIQEEEELGTLQILGLRENGTLEIATPWGREAFPYSLAERLEIHEK